jgi:hypothetical protein
LRREGQSNKRKAESEENEEERRIIRKDRRRELKSQENKNVERKM